MKIRLRDVFVIFCIAACTGCGNPEPLSTLRQTPRAVRLYTVEAVPDAEERIYPGRVKAGDKVMMSFQVEGRVEKVFVSGGLAVTKGTMLARLDPVIYQKRYDASEASFENARKTWERNRTLAERKIVSSSDLEKSRRDYDVARAEMEKAAEDLANTVIYAPFDGVVTNIYIDTHQQVNARQNIMLLQNLQTMLIDVDIPERDVAGSTKTIPESNRKYADRMYAYFPDNPQKRFPLKIKEYTAEADPVTQTFTITFFLLGAENLKLLPGVTMLTSLPDVRKVPEGERLHRIPAEAVFRRDGETYVWVIGKDWRVSGVPVDVKSIRGRYVYVSGALRSGMRIAASGGTLLTEGETVREFLPYGQSKGGGL